MVGHRPGHSPGKAAEQATRAQAEAPFAQHLRTGEGLDWCASVSALLRFHVIEEPQAHLYLRPCAGCTGKDVHKLCLPTHINEPLTELQKRAEVFQSSELLDEVILSDLPV